MHPFDKENRLIIGILSDAHDSIQNINNPEMLALKGRILGDLRKHINSLSVQLDLPIKDEPKAQGRQPITKMFGRTLTSVRKTLPAPDVNKGKFKQTTSDIELAELRVKVDELYNRFLSTPDDHLIDSLSDIEIRGVAKKAGLPVSENDPKTINTGFIKAIKDAIQKQMNINDLGEAGSEKEKGAGATEPLTPAEPIIPAEPTGPTLEENTTLESKENAQGPADLTGEKVNEKTEEHPDADKNLESAKEDEQNKDKEGEAYKERVTELYGKIVSLDNNKILADYTELEIRGVAKLAGLPVTEDSPKKIDKAFVNNLKNTVVKKNKQSNG